MPTFKIYILTVYKDILYIQSVCKYANINIFIVDETQQKGQTSISFVTILLAMCASVGVFGVGLAVFCGWYVRSMPKLYLHHSKINVLWKVVV